MNYREYAYCMIWINNGIDAAESNKLTVGHFPHDTDLDYDSNPLHVNSVMHLAHKGNPDIRRKAIEVLAEQDYFIYPELMDVEKARKFGREVAEKVQSRFDGDISATGGCTWYNDHTVVNPLEMPQVCIYDLNGDGEKFLLQEGWMKND